MSAHRVCGPLTIVDAQLTHASPVNYSALMSNPVSAHERASSDRERSVSARARGLRTAGAVRWLVLLATFALSASTWMALSDLTGYPHAIRALMAVAVDGYVVVALIVWLYARSPALATFAKRNTYAAAGYGIVAQSVFHAVSASEYTSTTYRVCMAAAVSVVPPLFAALTVHLSVQLARDLEAERSGSADIERPWKWDEMVSAQEALIADRPLVPEAELSAHERTTERVSAYERSVSARERALPLIAHSLSAGRALTGSTVAEEYGVSEQTGRRWIKDARALSAAPINERSLTLIHGDGERS